MSKLWQGVGLLAVFAVVLSGCAVKKRTVVPVARPALTASFDELLTRLEAQRAAVTSLNATVQLIPTAGSLHSGVIEEYHDVRAFILAERPARLRMIGQVPVVRTTAFDMATDGERFELYIPSKNRFIVGTSRIERPTKKPIERLRPQHILDALFLPARPADARVFGEENEAGGTRYYVLSVVRGADERLELAQKFWFDRADLGLVRVQRFEEGGRLQSDVFLSDYAEFGAARYPQVIRLVRPAEDYTLEIRIQKLAINETLAADKFVLERPLGTELVDLAAGNSARE